MLDQFVWQYHGKDHWEKQNIFLYLSLDPVCLLLCLISLAQEEVSFWTLKRVELLLKSAKYSAVPLKIFSNTTNSSWNSFPPQLCHTVAEYLADFNNLTLRNETWFNTLTNSPGQSKGKEKHFIFFYMVLSIMLSDI